MRTIFAFGLFLLPVLALAQSTAQRPGIVRQTQAHVQSDTATSKDFGGWIEWKSDHSGTKTQYLPHCDNKINGAMITVIDGTYDAANNPIDVVVTGHTSNVDGTTNPRQMNSNGAVMQLVCDGANNWIVLYDLESGSPPRTVTDQFLMNGGNQQGVSSTAPNVYCNPASPSTCSQMTWEDTLRGSDNGSVVVYESNHQVDVELPRNTPHGALHPGWETQVWNKGSQNVRIRSVPPSVIEGGVLQPNGGSRIVVPPHESVTIVSKPTEPNKDYGNYIFQPGTAILQEGAQ